MERTASRLSRWIYYLAAAFIYSAAVLRAMMVYSASTYLGIILAFLGLVLFLFLTEPPITLRFRHYFPIYLSLQTIIVFLLLGVPEDSDFFASLLCVLSMQVMLHLNPKIGAAWIGLCSIVTGVLIAMHSGVGDAIALTLIFTAIIIFQGTYALAVRREQTLQDKQLSLAAEIEQANRKLQDYSTQLEQLAVTRERNRFARELHDSVTQTVFSMTLSTQSAILLFQRNPSLVKDQLTRLDQLVRSALTEMQSLISTLKADESPGLVPAIRRHLADSHLAGKLKVSLQVDGQQALSSLEEQALLGIAQEALNNVLKHSQVDQAAIILHLEPPFWMEIRDQGCGFDAQSSREAGRLGLTSMQERAAEIGWELHVSTSPGTGTRIKVEKADKELK